MSTHIDNQFTEVLQLKQYILQKMGLKFQNP